MKCYKCGSPEYLSLKKRSKNGNTILICRDCRREQYSQYSERRKTIVYTKVQTVSKDWVRVAKEKNSALAQKYIDKAFLEYRGMS